MSMLTLDRTQAKRNVMMTGKVYSYTRFSSPAQAKGDSLRSQTKDAADWAALHGMTLDTDLTFHDAGLSAWTGENEGGQLGAFLEAVKHGVVPRGSVLAVESLDRLSRQGIRKTQRLIEDIVSAGVNVVTTKDGNVYDAEALDDPMGAITIILTATTARQESDQKSRRVSAAWANKRARAGETALTKNGPSWLTLGADRKTWTVDEDKADVVRRIYSLALEGFGPNAIATKLGEDGVKTLDSRALRYGNEPMWRAPTVSWLLGYSAVVGTLTTKGEAVEGYFPAIVDVETFSTVQAMRSGAKMAKGRHANDQTVRSVVAGLSRCPTCGRSMTRVTKSGGAKAYLICDGARYRSGCKFHSVSLRAVEEALVRDAWSFCTVAEAAVFEDGAPVLADLRAVESDIAAAEERLDNLLDVLSRDPSPAIRERIRETEAALDADREEARELAEAGALSGGPMVKARLERLRAALAIEPLDPKAVNVALRACASKVVVDWRLGCLELHWLHGGVASVVFGVPPD